MFLAKNVCSRSFLIKNVGFWPQNEFNDENTNSQFTKLFVKLFCMTDKFITLHWERNLIVVRNSYQL